MGWDLAVTGLLGVYGGHRAATYAAGRGWIYYRDGPRRGNTMGLIEEIFQPSYKHVLEEQASQAVEAADLVSTGPGRTPLPG